MRAYCDAFMSMYGSITISSNKMKFDCFFNLSINIYETRRKEISLNQMFRFHLSVKHHISYNIIDLEGKIPHCESLFSIGFIPVCTARSADHDDIKYSPLYSRFDNEH
jgi:hypothetical protein